VRHHMYYAMHGLIERRLAWLRHRHIDGEELPVNIVSWNVNGIRALLQRNHLAPLVATSGADVLCLQETKAQPEQVRLDLPSHPYHYSTVVIWSGHIGSREDHALLLGKDLRKDLVNQGTLG
jgi:hypothetical protein